jgi:predicted RNase H-like nuclease (RuvC/YqgF family)
VRAAEEALLRKVHEHQKLAARQKEEPPSAKDLRRKQRTALRELREKEGRITSLEARIATLTAALEDPALYTRPGGVAEAKTLGGELDGAKRELDEALADWAAASESVELNH